MKFLNINLQLFADDDEGVNDADSADLQEADSTDIDDSVDSDTETDTESEDEPEEGENEAEVAEPQANDSEKQSSDDNAKYAAARREAEKQAKSLKERQDNFAKQYGYNTFEELEQAQRQQDYEKKGYDPEMAAKLVQVDQMMVEMAEQKNKARIVEEKSKLQSQPFFKELESEIDAILETNAQLPVEMVFDLVKGKNISKLLSKQGKVATQKALNNLNSKSHIKADGKGTDVDTVFIDEAEWNFYQKLNPKAKREDFAKFIKSEKRR